MDSTKRRTLAEAPRVEAPKAVGVERKGNGKGYSPSPAD